jgi:hypothetical protein
MGPSARSPSGTHLDDPVDDRLAVADSLTSFGHTVVVRDRRYKLIEHFDGCGFRTIDPVGTTLCATSAFTRPTSAARCSTR